MNLHRFVLILLPCAITPFSTPAPSFSTTSSSSHDPLRVLKLLTFDLDDTLFPIKEAVEDANVVMMQHLQNSGYPDATLEGYTLASKRIRAGVGSERGPIKYSDLRMQSILSEMNRCRRQNQRTDEIVSHSPLEDEVVVQSAYKSWLTERNASAERNLFPGTVEMLKCIRKCHPSVIIGGVTNGRGDVFQISPLGDYFEFSICGEDDGVFPNQKPHRGIYEKAFEVAKEISGIGLPAMEDMASSSSCAWVHVGDDLANDVGASAACGAIAVWMKVEDENVTKEASIGWSTATKEERDERKKRNEEARQFVSAKISKLAELPNVIMGVL